MPLLLGKVGWSLVVGTGVEWRLVWSPGSSHRKLLWLMLRLGESPDHQGGKEGLPATKPDQRLRSGQWQNCIPYTSRCPRDQNQPGFSSS